MVEIPGKELFRKLFSGPAAAIVAAVVGGVFSVASAVVPYFMATGTTNPPATNELSKVLAEVEAKVAPPPAVKQHLTYGTWTLLESHDDEGNDWSNSVLKFTSQKPTEDGLEVEGFFEWRNGRKLMGREYVRGNYVEATRNLYIEGQKVENVEGQLAVGSFSARLAEDNRHLIDGTWGCEVGQETGVPGTWRARR